MLLPNNIAPEDSIYYNGAIVLDIAQREHRISLANLFCEVNKSKSLSFSMFLLCFLMLPISDRGTMISATVNMNLSVSSFNSISFWFMYFEALLLGKYAFKIIRIS